MSKIKKFAAVTTIAGMFTVSAFIGHTVTEYDRNGRAVQVTEDTVQSSCFEVEWHNSKLDLAQTNGLTKLQVLDKVRHSKNEIEFEMYRSWKNTVGYTYATTKRIWMNRKFHDSYTTCEKAANIGHEILGHKNGFGHDVAVTKRRPYSVPYMIGTVIKKCCKE